MWYDLNMECPNPVGPIEMQIINLGKKKRTEQFTKKHGIIGFINSQN
jgi:hypothetical protein